MGSYGGEILPGAMSEENVERLRAAFEVFNRWDFDEGVQLLHPDVELRPGIVGPGVTEGPYRGRDEVRSVLGDDQRSLGFAENRALGDTRDSGRVLAVERWRVRGRDGIELDFEVIDVYAFRDGLIFRIDGFTDRAEAFEATGLRE